MSRSLFDILAPSVALVLLGGCAHDRVSNQSEPLVSEQQPPVDGMLPEPGAGLGAGATQPELVGVPATVASPATPPAPPAGEDALDDHAIVQLTEVANAGEIAQAKLALKRATNRDVRKLARMIEMQHKDAQRDAMRVAKDDDLAPVTTPTSTKLQSDADQTLADLVAKHGADFDRAYVDAQVIQHQDVLKLIDDKLMPEAQSADVKNLVSKIRPHIQMHLDRAKALQQKLDK